MPLWFQPAAAQSLDDILSAPQLPPYQWFASTDPQNKNADYIELKPGETRRIPLAAGRLERLWSTGFEPDKLVLELQNGSRTVLLENNQARHGNFFKKAYTLYPDTSTPTALRELKSGAALVATNKSKQPNKWFYQATVRASLWPRAATPGPTKTAIEAAAIPAGESRVLFNAQNPGTVVNLALRFDTVSYESLRGLRLIARWDTKAEPAVDVPLLALTGQFFDALPVQAAAYRLEKDAINIRWPMSFAAGAEISLRNDGDTAVNLAASEISTLSTSSQFRFCAQFGSARTQKGKPLEILNVTGEGAFVGLAMGIAPSADTTRRTFAYLEGNEIITADGKTYEGTGTEDYFNSAWYYPDEPFSQPYGGMTFKSLLPPRVSMYRLMIPDAVPFQKNLRFQFEHGNGNNSSDLEYSWATFWYQKPPLQFEIADALPIVKTVQSAPRENWGQPVIWSALGFVSLVVILGIVAWFKRKSIGDNQD